jgi:hypothetical protein
MAPAVAAPDTEQVSPSCLQYPPWSSGREMSFTVQKRPGERPVLLAQGVIDDALMPRLRAAIDAFPGDEVWLGSTGGNERIGRQAASLIRRSNVMTRIPAGWTCSGACAEMFLGGFARRVEPGGQYVVEPRVVEDGDTASVARRSALMASEDEDFLIRMGISRALLRDVLYAPPRAEARRCLTPAELRRYNITNVLDAPRQ